MASHAGGLIQDQNLNVHFNGASAGGKGNVSRVLRKGGLGGRKPLGDVSNSVRPSPNQALKKQNSDIFSTEKEIGASKITNDASKNKSVSKASEKAWTGSRKALTDISNSGRPGLRNASKKNQNAKLSFVPEKTIHSSVIAEEQFLHNHQECIKAQTKAMDMDEFLKTVGLDSDFTKQLASPWAPPLLSKLKPENSLMYLELEEMAEPLIEDQSFWKHELSHKLDSSPPPCRTPRSPNHYFHRKDNDNINFMLMETPELPKH